MAKPAYTKPFHTPQQSIALLEQRGMVVDDHAKAASCLKRIGYYRLSAYWHPFRRVAKINGVNTFQDDFYGNPSFDDVVNFYVFDKTLRGLMTDALERIEVALRAQIANVLGKKDPIAHRTQFRLDNKFITQPSHKQNNLTKHQYWLQSQDENFKRSKEDFATHYKKNYSSPAPIWIAKEAWDWGTLSHFYSGMQWKDKKKISQYYGNIDPNELASWLRALNDIRNICAHHSRLWNRGLVVTIIVPNNVQEFTHIHNVAHSCSRLYGSLVTMVYLMRILHPNTKWHERLLEHLINNTPLNNKISFNSAGFTDNWQNELCWC